MDVSEFAHSTASGSVPSGLGRRRNFGRTSAREARGVLAALAQEAYDVALLVAVTGSVVNAIVSSRRPQLRPSLATYLPNQPVLFPGSVATGTVSAALAAETIQTMIAFYGLVTFARNATLGYSARREPGGVGGPVSMETLGEAWQAAAAQGVGVLTALGFIDRTTNLAPAGKDQALALKLVEQLWDVALGRTPCVRVDGAVIIPGWIERRTHLRREVNAPAVMSVNGTQHRVTVRDLSAGGLGIEGATQVQPGDEVSVALGSGVELYGVAVWTNGGRIGIKLVQSN